MTESQRDAHLRAVVLSGGGAKGVFESGALHAFYQVGLEPDVITGSSVGAINAVAYAEVICARRSHGEDAARETMNRALTLWQRLDRMKIADLDGWGWRVFAVTLLVLLLGGAVLSWVVAGQPLGGWLGWLQFAAVLVLGVGLLYEGFWLIRTWVRLPGWMRKRVRQGMTNLVEHTESEEQEAADKGKVFPGKGLLRVLGLYPALFSHKGLERALATVVAADRRLSDYRSFGIDVRLTRTNVRTGRTEISEYATRRELQRPGIERGRRVLGDPYVRPSALASAAFPVAFPPVSAERIYPPPDNPELIGTVADRSSIKQILTKIFGPHAKEEYLWLMALLDSLSDEDREIMRIGNEERLSRKLQESFTAEHSGWTRVSQHGIDTLIDTRHWPQLPVPGVSQYSDHYFDGGVLDNTPMATALQALRDILARRHAGRESTTPQNKTSELINPIHEAFVVLLAPPPRRRYLSAREAGELAGPALGARALRLQAEKRLAEDIRQAEKIDALLAQRGLVATAAKSAAQKVSPAKVLVTGGPDAASTDTAVDAMLRGESWPEVFSRENLKEPGKKTPAETEPEGLVRVRVTRVYPSWDLPWVMSLDDRLGFSREQAMRFQTRGCRDTLIALNDRYRETAESNGSVPEHGSAAARLVGGGSRHVSVHPGWVCRAEQCAIRKTCDQLAAEESESHSHPVASPASRLN